MSLTHLHLLLNHVPVVGIFIGLALMGVALMRRNSDLAKVTLGLFVALALVTLTVYFSGEPAEEAVEGLPGVAESIIGMHEEAALIATVAAGLLGAAAAAVLVLFRRRSIARWAMTASFLGAFVAAGVFGWTAKLGGQIRHTEIRAGSGSDTRDDREGRSADLERGDDH